MIVVERASHGGQHRCGARGRADGRRVERRPRRVVIREGDVGTGGKNDDGAAQRQQLQVAQQGKEEQSEVSLHALHTDSICSSNKLMQIGMVPF